MVIKHDGAGTNCRYVFMGLGLRLRHLLILVTLFVIMMTILSISYPNSDSSRILTSKVRNLRNLEDVRSLKISEEKSVVRAPLNPNQIVTDRSGSETTFEKDQEVSLPLPTENPVGDDKQVLDEVSLPLASPYHTDQLGEETFDTTNIDEDLVKEILLVPDVQMAQVEGASATDYSTAKFNSGIEVNPMEQGKRIELISDDPQQGRDIDESYKETTDSNERQYRLPGTTLIQPFDSSERTGNFSSSKGECDMTLGKWVHDPAGPLYDFDQCSMITAAQNCQFNGRPDHEYESYKWEPDQCSLPRLDPNEFLELMRGKTLAFIGDSLARNQMVSLMCILLQAAEALKKSKKGIHRWYFPSHDFTVIRIWSSWLVETKGHFPASIAPPDARNLNLSELDSYAQHLPTFDVTIISSGHWWVRKLAFFREGRIVGGGSWPWPPSAGVMEMNSQMAFETALSNTLHKVGSYPGYKGLTILRTFSPDHYKGGSWDTGGSCTGETKPYEDGPRNDFNELMYELQLKAFKRNTPECEGGYGKNGSGNGSKLRLLDVYPILNYRGDGHAGPYRSADPNKQTTVDSKGRLPPQDCLHWCMPGPVDTMNELLFDLLRKEMQ